MGTVKSRVAVVGGGITGAFAAYFLSKLGAEAVIIERARIAAGASGHNAGGLNPLHGPGIAGPTRALALASLHQHLNCWDDVRELAGADFGGQSVPRLLIAFEEREAAELRALEALYNDTPGFSARWLSADELRSAEPRVSAAAIGALRTDGNIRVDPRAYAPAVARAAARLGARVVTAEAHGVRQRDGRITAISLDCGELECDGAVIAPGPWCEAPARWLGARLPVRPLKGELLLAACDVPVEVAWDSVGVHQAGAGRVWLGGIEDRSGFDASPTGSARARILDGIGRLLPGLHSPRIVDQVAGLRPVTPDGLPIIGIPDGWENVCVATGSGRKGVLFSAGLGLAAAELLTTGQTGVPIGACGLQRPGLRA
jgi:glycine oxidase